MKVPVDAYVVRGDAVVRVMSLVAEILRKEMAHFDEVFFNVSSGSKMLSCAGLSAAFVNGIKAVGATGSGVFHLPVLKFSYSELISESKLKILQSLMDLGGSAESLAALEQDAKVERSLLSYHIRGGKDSKGLADLGLVDVDRGDYGKLSIRITELGRLVLVGR